MNDTNESAGAPTLQAAVVIERTYRASVEALWALWTTKPASSRGGVPRFPRGGPRPGGERGRRAGVRHDRRRSRGDRRDEIHGAAAVHTARADASPSSGQTSS